MSTELTWEIESSSLEDTLLIAEQVGRNLRGGEVIELVSDLGGGKTAFVRGLAIGIGSEDTVHSPSFTISNQYQSGNFILHHLDFYRLSDAGLMKQQLAEILSDPLSIVVVEWANIVEDILPERHLVVTIKTTGETNRKLIFEYPEKLAYIIPNNT
ncbi:MAG: tRNA (adenosine(37)-N6)-threonylcarbamoyltransferase complex ATPase subunit type 1 TsaE [Patescibacteria group bacterium]